MGILVGRAVSCSGTESGKMGLDGGGGLMSPNSTAKKKRGKRKRDRENFEFGGQGTE